ncbi:MAG: hypothetical protein ACP5HM_13735 [Anaerolineae bacterium]
MLRELLRVLAADEGIQTPVDVARALDVAPALVEDMIRQLVRQGYLSPSGQCQAGCAACPLKSACGARHQQTRFWTLTPKAKHLLSS